MKHCPENILLITIVCIVIIQCTFAGCTGNGSNNSGSSTGGSGGGSAEGASDKGGIAPNAYFTVSCHYERYNSDPYTGVQQDTGTISGTVPFYIDDFNVRDGGVWSGDAHSENLTATASHAWICSGNQEEEGCVPQSSSYNGPGYFHAFLDHTAGDPINQVSLLVSGEARADYDNLLPYYSQSDDKLYDSMSDDEKIKWKKEQAEMISDFDLICGSEFINNNQFKNDASGYPVLSLEGGDPLTLSEHKKTSSGYTNIDAQITLHKGATPLPSTTTIPPSLEPLVTTPEPLAPLITITSTEEPVTLAPLVTTP